MTDIYKAINAQLEILHLKKRITELQQVVDQNITIDQIKNPNIVEVDPLLVEAAIKKASYVGHQLVYKDIEINLYTESGNVERKIFRAVMKGDV